MNAKYMPIFLFFLAILAACTPATPVAPSEQPVSTLQPTEMPVPETIRHYGDWDREYMTCQAVMRVTLNGATMKEGNATIKFDSKKYNPLFSQDYQEKEWMKDFNAQTERFAIEADSEVNTRIVEKLGLEGLIKDFEIDVLLITEPPQYKDDANCPEQWIVEFIVSVGSSSYPDNWTVTTEQAFDTLYFYIDDQNGNHLEIPLYTGNIVAMGSEYDETTIRFTDPTTIIGADQLEDAVILHATNIKSEGELVGRFTWSSIQGQEVILRVLANALLLKAAQNPEETHQAAFFAFLREQTVASTSVTIFSKPTHGSFFLGIGSLSGGGSNMSYNQRIENLLAISGELYVR